MLQYKRNYLSSMKCFLSIFSELATKTTTISDYLKMKILLDINIATITITLNMEIKYHASTI